ncbi:MAG: J domain-containing protein [Treponema sp.]|nr:J domain-containing protein [Treponema sp.]
MGFWDRLGNVIKSYLNDDDTLYRDNSGSDTGNGWSNRSPSGDPDLQAAYEELNDYLNNDNPDRDAAGDGSQQAGNGASGRFSGASAQRPKTPPQDLRPDFAELGVEFGASADDCKEAYKKLLKIHHPDRHTKSEADFQKATAKTARINASWDRITAWRSTTP